jgi:four helix bundle protein
VVSIESNISEGFSRYHFKDRLNFYYDSRGSLSEVQTQLLIAKDIKYVSDIDFQSIFVQTEKVAIILSGLIRSTDNLSKK